MKKLVSMLIVISLVFLCSCESIFKDPPENQLEKEDFTFIDLEGEESLEIKINQYLYITSMGAYYYNMENGNDMTISTTLCTARGIMYLSYFDEFKDVYELESDYAVWSVISLDTEDEDAESKTTKLIYKDNSINNLGKEVEYDIQEVSLCIGYYKQGKKWLKLDGDRIMKITESEEGFSIDGSDDFVLIAISLNSDLTIGEICYYYADTENIINQF